MKLGNLLVLPLYAVLAVAFVIAAIVGAHVVLARGIYALATRNRGAPKVEATPLCSDAVRSAGTTRPAALRPPLAWDHPVEGPPACGNRLLI